MITYQKTLTVTIDCSVLSEEKIVDALGMIKGVLKVDPYASISERHWKVYKLVSKKDPLSVYIGSTRAKLSQRLGGHMDGIKLYPESDKSKWLKENEGYIEIIAVAVADSEEDIILLEEQQMIRYIKLGYNVLNRKYPKTGKRYSGKDNHWKIALQSSPELRFRMLECIEHWAKTKDSPPSLTDIRQDIGDVTPKEFHNAYGALILAGLVEQGNNRRYGEICIPAKVLLPHEEKAKP